MARIPKRLVALSTAAVVTVYAAGYLRTKAAAERFSDEDGPRRSTGPARVPVAIAQPRSLPAADTAPLAIAMAVPTAVATSPAVAPKKEPAAKRPAPTVVEPASPKPAVEEQTPPVETPVEPAPPPAPKWKDGTYYGWGTSRHGDLQAGLVIESGKIVTVSITQCLTRYSCSVIAHLLPQVIGRQSADVDYVSGATQSVNAFYYAVLEALNKAK